MSDNRKPEKSSSRQSFEAAALVMLMFVGLFSIIGLLFWGGSAIDFAQSQERHRIECITAWDTRFQPKFEGDQCSIMQRGYRIPAPKVDAYNYSPNSISSPEAAW